MEELVESRKKTRRDPVRTSASRKKPLGLRIDHGKRDSQLVLSHSRR